MKSKKQIKSRSKADQKQIKTFSEASRLKPVPQLEPKSIPQDACDALVGPASAGKRPVW
jgi:hypothetical protein